MSNYQKQYKNKHQSIEVFSTNLSEDFYLHWIYYSIFDSTPNLSFFENKIREDNRLKMTFLKQRSKDQEIVSRYKNLISEILELKSKGISQWEQVKNLIPPEELSILQLDDKIKTIRNKPSIPYEQFDRLFDKKIRETITNYKINDFIDTISNDVGDIDHISKIDKLNKEFQDLIYDYLNQMNQMINKNNNLVITNDNVKELIQKRIEIRKNQHYKHLDMPSGFPTLDRIVFQEGGFQTSRLYLISGKTGLGKSIFCINLQKNFIEQGKTVQLFTLENTREEMEDRLYSNISQINVNHLYSKENIENVKNSVCDFFEKSGGGFYIEQIPTDILTKEMIDTIITLKINKGLKKPDVIIVDYLDLMHFSGNEEERIRLSKLTSQLKQIAQEQNCVVISPTQLNREQYKTDNINVSHLSESSGKQYNQDGVFILNGSEEMVSLNLVELIISKLRHGKSYIKLLFELDYEKMTFRDLLTTNINQDEYEEEKQRIIEYRKDLIRQNYETNKDLISVNNDIKNSKKINTKKNQDDQINSLFNQWTINDNND